MRRQITALSVRQPWAWLIIHGYKPIENRQWSTTHRGLILIHAPQRFEHDVFEHWPWRDIERPDRDALLTGGIVGEARIVTVTERRPADFDAAAWRRWRDDSTYALILADAQPRRFRACPGARGRLFVPDLGAPQRQRTAKAYNNGEGALW